MAARRVGQKFVDFAAFAERVPPNQRAQFLALKSKSEAIKAKFTALPEKPKAIDWAYYRKRVPVAGLVDKFEKQYSAVNVPYPKDTATAAVEEQEKQMDKLAADFKVESEKRIAEYEKELAQWTTMIPFEDMTKEEFAETFPETLEQRKKYPHWPHYPYWE
ncbi:ATP synthase peripheral stalk subunit d, mitochondrial-like [Saccoglossus kowalevskii]|uniref:ATP synthase subunit d, mitochondrial n=1 Tax=Saccoglossus kowalevskii TaxID=10224 RepID=A0ABM0GY61_SACKO|nr:PREDICTED: ATP synthase subunit d, mitochondrial-like [Saccoglossus kowalevskii]